MRLPRNAAAFVLVGGLLALGACASEGGNAQPDKGSKATTKEAAPAASGSTAKALEPQASPKPDAKAKGDGAPKLDDLRRDRSVKEQARRQLIEVYTKKGDDDFARSRLEAAEQAYGSVLDQIGRASCRERV